MMLKHKVKKIIFSSSCAVYGMPTTQTLNEDHHRSPINPYGNTKLAIELLHEDCAHAYDFQFVALRYFNAAGALPDIGLGEYHEPETHLIPLLLRAVKNNKRFYIFGTDYPTPDGTCMRDFLHVSDIAQAHLDALTYLGENSASAAFNLGTGSGYSVREIIETVERICGKKIDIIESDRRPGDPPMLVANASKAMKELKWQPKFSDLATIISCAWDFESRRHPLMTATHPQPVAR